MQTLTQGTLLHSSYQLEHCLQQRPGQQTWRATDIRTRQPVIVKSLELSSMPDWDALRLFEREIQVLQTLEHPQIPKLLDSFRAEDQQQIFLVMQAIQGQSLRERLEQGPLDEAAAKELARQLLRILNYLHHFSPPVIHRDIKPGNLLLDSQQQVYLIDFGAVKDLSSSQQTVVGTFAYLAPEQLAGQAQPASDLYALGITLAEALSGIAAEALPREGLRLKLEQVIRVSAGFREWLQELLAPETSLRFKSAQEALQALNALPLPFRPEQVALAADTRLQLQIQPDELNIQIQRTRRPLDYLQALLILGAISCSSLFGMIGLMGITLMITDSLYGWRPAWLKAWDALLNLQLMPELWLSAVPVLLLAWSWSLWHIYRLWFRPLSLQLTEHALRLENAGKPLQIELTQLKRLQFSAHFVLLINKSSWLSAKKISCRLSAADRRSLKTLCREYLRQNLSKQDFQALLPDLKT